MAKFINKKEQVFDIKLTSYGHYLLSIGKFKPAYYSFYDDNVLYDKKYANSSATENQNDINDRIKNGTQYIESMVLFRDVEDTLNNSQGAYNWYNESSITPRQIVPTKDVFKFDSPLGDALNEGMGNKVPAWKIVALSSKIDNSAQNDNANNSLIPQLNITALYTKKVFENEITDTETESAIRESLSRTSTFVNGKVIKLLNNDPLYYIEEMNTQLLTRNFDIEIFQILSSSNTDSYYQIERKYFKSDIPQVQNGFLVSETKQSLEEEITTDSVDYYFEVLVDNEVNQTKACRSVEIFNKQSYYVDLDFDCEEIMEDNVLFDIYGTVTEPEICLD